MHTSYSTLHLGINLLLQSLLLQKVSRIALRCPSVANLRVLFLLLRSWGLQKVAITCRAPSRSRIRVRYKHVVELNGECCEKDFTVHSVTFHHVRHLGQFHYWRRLVLKINLILYNLLILHFSVDFALLFLVLLVSCFLW